MGGEELFTKQMRIATRDIHQISDALVNAKLGFALNDPSVWADGLLVFYEVFAYLEGAIDRQSCPQLAQLDIPGMRRRAAFESDLDHYLGSGWRCQPPRPAVQIYLDHLRHLEQHKPVLLLAYVWHLYMGLLSGGQILRRKRAFLSRLSPVKLVGSGSGGDCDGGAVTDFSPLRPAELKTRLRAAMNQCASTLDDQLRSQLITEGRQLFRLNNQIVASVRGVNSVVWRRSLYLALVFALIAVVWCLLWR